MGFDHVKLEKGMYRESGKTFTQVLESLDPSENYRGCLLYTSYEFAENFRKSGLCRRGDVGIDPYACDRAYTCYDSGRHPKMAAAFGVFRRFEECSP